MVVTRRGVIRHTLVLLVLQSLIWETTSAIINGSDQESTSSDPLRPTSAPMVAAWEEAIQDFYADHQAIEIRNKRAVDEDKLAVSDSSCPATGCVDECACQYCHNGATFVESLNSFECICAAGFTDDQCMTDIDECAPDPCHNGATCVDGVNSYSCVCVAGFTGDQCLTDINECASFPCMNGGICRNLTNEYRCDCLAGYTGDRCQTDIDECASNPCHSGATCVDGVNSYSCVCAAGFTGDQCLTDINECASSPCLNGGICHNLTNQYRCDCPTGYRGDRCETVSARKLKIDEVRPLFGPMAGGTQITVIGQNLLSVDTITLGPANEYSCHVVSSNSSVVIAETPPSKVHGDKLPILVKFTGQLSQNTGMTFEYKPDPKITKIEPLETIINGGTTLTVSGSALNSVATPVLEITMVITRRVELTPGTFSYNVTKEVFSSNCDGERNTADVIYCPTSELKIPEDLLQFVNNQNINIQNRTRRSIQLPENLSRGDFMITNAMVNSAPKLTSSGSKAVQPITGQRTHSSRVKRQTDVQIDLKFYIGFKLDGVDSFKNLSASAELRQYSELTVYGTPKVYRLADDDHLIFKKGEPMTIKGEGMNRGSTRSDYAIKIGLGDCDIMDLVDTSVTCLPPQKTPEKRQNDTDTLHVIMVHIGLNVQYEYGRILYKQGPSYILASTAVVPLVLLGIAIAVAIVMWRRKKRAANESTRHLDQPIVDQNIYDWGCRTDHGDKTKEVFTVGQDGLIDLGELKICDDFEEEFKHQSNDNKTIVEHYNGHMIDSKPAIEHEAYLSSMAGGEAVARNPTSRSIQSVKPASGIKVTASSKRDSVYPPRTQGHSTRVNSTKDNIDRHEHVVGMLINNRMPEQSSSKQFVNNSDTADRLDSHSCDSEEDGSIPDYENTKGWVTVNGVGKSSNTEDEVSADDFKNDTDVLHSSGNDEGESAPLYENMKSLNLSKDAARPRLTDTSLNQGASLCRPTKEKQDSAGDTGGDTYV